MPDIEKVKEFKREILDDISDERVKKEPFGIKMDIEPPRMRERIFYLGRNRSLFLMQKKNRRTILI